MTVTPGQGGRLVVLVSGRGSNLRALLGAIGEGRCAGRVVGVVSDRPEAPALRIAEEAGIATAVVPRDRGTSRETWCEGLGERVAAMAPDWVVLAGFMRILAPGFVRRFAGRIVNVHPSLLPAFPGLDAPGQAIRAGVRIAGCTVHLVDEGVDTGPVLAQAAVPVLDGDDPAGLHARIQRQEHRLLPAVVDALVRGELVAGPPPRWRGRSLAPGTLWSPLSPPTDT